MQHERAAETESAVWRYPPAWRQREGGVCSAKAFRVRSPLIYHCFWLKLESVKNKRITSRLFFLFFFFKGAVSPHLVPWWVWGAVARRGARGTAQLSSGSEWFLADLVWGGRSSFHLLLRCRPAQRRPTQMWAELQGPKNNNNNKNKNTLILTTKCWLFSLLMITTRARRYSICNIIENNKCLA